MLSAPETADWDYVYGWTPGQQTMGLHHYCKEVLMVVYHLQCQRWKQNHIPETYRLLSTSPT